MSKSKTRSVAAIGNSRVILSERKRVEGSAGGLSERKRKGSKLVVVGKLGPRRLAGATICPALARRRKTPVISSTSHIETTYAARPQPGTGILGR